MAFATPQISLFSAKFCRFGIARSASGALRLWGLRRAGGNEHERRGNSVTVAPVARAKQSQKVRFGSEADIIRVNHAPGVRRGRNSLYFPGDQGIWTAERDSPQTASTSGGDKQENRPTAMRRASARPYSGPALRLSVIRRLRTAPIGASRNRRQLKQMTL